MKIELKLNTETDIKNLANELQTLLSRQIGICNHPNTNHQSVLDEDKQKLLTHISDLLDQAFTLGQQEQSK